MTALTCVFHTQQKKQLRVKYLKYLCNDGLIETISCASRHKSLDSIDASTLTLYIQATEHKQRGKRERSVEEEKSFHRKPKFGCAVLSGRRPSGEI